MLHFALIGERLGHSLSVPIHEAMFRHLGIHADYKLVEMARDDFAPRVRELMQVVDGFNITIPYKQDVMPLLQSIDHRAQDIGAVNTVTVRGADRVSCGYNTDVLGLKAMLERYGILPKGKPCYCLGTGGASKAAVAALKEMGAESIALISRTPGEHQLNYEQFSRFFEGGIIVNTTPCGMWPKADGCPLSEEQLARVLPLCDGVADLIYNPKETRLTAAAKEAGVKACTGLYMLVNQAVEAEKLWLERELPDDMTERLMEEIHL